MRPRVCRPGSAQTISAFTLPEAGKLPVTHGRGLKSLKQLAVFRCRRWQPHAPSRTFAIDLRGDARVYVPILSRPSGPVRGRYSSFAGQEGRPRGFPAPRPILRSRTWRNW
jgi:hypothetical protein